MAYEQRDNQGTLFKNDKREKDTHPNATGKAMIDGRMYYVSAWTKQGSKGPFQSLAFKPVDEAQPSRSGRDNTEGRRVSTGEDIEDSIPFGPEFR
jgi:hypothetical protein